MRVRVPTALLALVAGAALAPASALGGAQHRGGPALAINGSKQVRTGQSARLTIIGRTPQRRGLAIYLDDLPCARGVAAEEARGISRQLVVRPVRGSFTHTVTFLRSSSGSHYICAYLYHGDGGNFVTDRYATFHYVTH